MSFLLLVFSWLIICNVAAGKIVQGIIGRNVSFSWTYNRQEIDYIRITHNASRLLWVWPANTYSEIHEKTERVRVTVEKTANQTETVTVSILNITTNDGGMYRVMRQWRSRVFKDNILLQTFGESIIPMIAIAGHNILDTTLTLECIVSSTSTDKFLWSLNGSFIVNHGRYFQTNAFLFIKNMTIEDQYHLYKCTQSGSGVHSDSYNIAISGPNAITFEANITMIQEYSRVNITCLAHCHPICTWSWKKIDPSSGREKVISTARALYIQNSTRKDAGTYSCRVQNKITGVSLENFTSLEIVYGPDEVVLNSSDNIIELNERDSVTISCSADCFPPCDIHWTYQNAETWIPAADIKLDNEKRNFNYTCHAMNPRKENTMISETIYVIIKSDINYSSTTAMTQTEDIGDVSFKRQLPYIVLGVGTVVAIAILAGLLHKSKKRLHLDIVTSTNTFRDANVENENENVEQRNLSGTYWTILSNSQGGTNTAIETDFEWHREQLLVGQNIYPTYTESEQSLSSNNAIINEELNGYLHPIHTDPIELDEYIHSACSDPVELGEVFHLCHSDLRELDEVIHPIHRDPMEHDAYIHPIPSDPVKRDKPIGTIHCSPLDLDDYIRSIQSDSVNMDFVSKYKSHSF